uniref:Family with sequence similarity 167 member Ab n=1 Tax=Electrophorus electricus TaxID=8005 RepID=A0A4W4F645_ELEEL
MIPQINVEDMSSLVYDDPEVTTDDHLRTLKVLTEKLRLQTRRPSYLEWKSQVEAQCTRGSSEPTEPTELDQGAGEEHRAAAKANGPKFIQKRNLASGSLKGFGNIDEALVWLRKELVSHKSPNVCIN